MSSPRPKPATPSRSTLTPSPAPSGGGEGRSLEEPDVEPDTEQDADLPLTMAASVVLTSLPKDAHEALEAVGKEGEGEKVTVRLVPLGAAKPLKQNRFKITASKRFDTVIRNLRRRVGVREAESIFCYINQTFSPAPDEGVGNLWKCFKTNDELVVHYAITPTYG
ncbi:APG12-domain-containing protein [Rhizodiscina lignyota]|uniref:Ubiquitin-like protein ATG12 n=1 Tax=Rhizodiscina lignyota TaxID=1504668 RepID=A0A9P4IF67_9PEZI|nr:APG12-domain-containing protein [Rhizodiscina lignyota]